MNERTLSSSLRYKNRKICCCYFACYFATGISACFSGVPGETAGRGAAQPGSGGCGASCCARPAACARAGRAARRGEQRRGGGGGGGGGAAAATAARGPFVRGEARSTVLGGQRRQRRQQKQRVGCSKVVSFRSHHGVLNSALDWAGRGRCQCPPPFSLGGPGAGCCPRALLPRRPASHCAPWQSRQPA